MNFFKSVFISFLFFSLFVGECFANGNMKIMYGADNTYIFSNISGASNKMGKAFFKISHKKNSSIDVMITIENTDKEIKFNKLELKAKDDGFQSDNLAIEWDGIDKNAKALVDGQYKINILVVDSEDNIFQDNSQSFNIDNTPPEIRDVSLVPQEDNKIKFESQIFDNSKIDKIIFKYTTKDKKKEELELAADTIQEGIYTKTVPSENLSNNNKFEGIVSASDKAGNISTANITIKLTPDIEVEDNLKNIYFNGDTLPQQMNIKGKYKIGTKNIKIDNNFESAFDLEGSNWIKKLEIKNLTNNKVLTASIFETGDWELTDIKDFLDNGENRLEYIYINCFDETTSRNFPASIIYDSEVPVIKKAYQWTKTHIILEMNEKVKIINENTIDDTTFEVDLIDSNRQKSTFSASGKIINNDINIEIQPEQAFLDKIQINDKIVVRINKLSDLAGNIPATIESEEFVSDK